MHMPSKRAPRSSESSSRSHRVGSDAGTPATPSTSWLGSRDRLSSARVDLFSPAPPTTAHFPSSDLRDGWLVVAADVRCPFVSPPNELLASGLLSRQDTCQTPLAWRTTSPDEDFPSFHVFGSKEQAVKCEGPRGSRRSRQDRLARLSRSTAMDEYSNLTARLGGRATLLCSLRGWIQVLRSRADRVRLTALRRYREHPFDAWRASSDKSARAFLDDGSLDAGSNCLFGEASALLPSPVKGGTKYWANVSDEQMSNDLLEESRHLLMEEVGELTNLLKDERAQKKLLERALLDQAQSSKRRNATACDIPSDSDRTESAGVVVLCEQEVHADGEAVAIPRREEVGFASSIRGLEQRLAVSERACEMLKTKLEESDQSCEMLMCKLEDVMVQLEAEKTHVEATAADNENKCICIQRTLTNALLQHNDEKQYAALMITSLEMKVSEIDGMCVALKREVEKVAVHLDDERMAGTDVADVAAKRLAEMQGARDDIVQDIDDRLKGTEVQLRSELTARDAHVSLVEEVSDAVHRLQGELKRRLSKMNEDAGVVKMRKESLRFLVDELKGIEEENEVGASVNRLLSERLAQTDEGLRRLEEETICSMEAMQNLKKMPGEVKAHMLLVGAGQGDEVRLKSEFGDSPRRNEVDLRHVLGKEEEAEGATRHQNENILSGNFGCSLLVRNQDLDRAVKSSAEINASVAVQELEERLRLPRGKLERFEIENVQCALTISLLREALEVAEIENVQCALTISVLREALEVAECDVARVESGLLTSMCEVDSTDRVVTKLQQDCEEVHKCVQKKRDQCKTAAESIGMKIGGIHDLEEAQLQAAGSIENGAAQKAEGRCMRMEEELDCAKSNLTTLRYEAIGQISKQSSFCEQTEVLKKHIRAHDQSEHCAACGKRLAYFDAMKSLLCSVFMSRARDRIVFASFSAWSRRLPGMGGYLDGFASEGWARCTLAVLFCAWRAVSVGQAYASFVKEKQACGSSLAVEKEFSGFVGANGAGNLTEKCSWEAFEIARDRWGRVYQSDVRYVVAALRGLMAAAKRNGVLKSKDIYDDDELLVDPENRKSNITGVALDNGLRITDILQFSPAAESCGLRVGDVLLAVNGARMTCKEDADSRMQGRAGERLVLTVERQGKGRHHMVLLQCSQGDVLERMTIRKELQRLGTCLQGAMAGLKKTERLAQQEKIDHIEKVRCLLARTKQATSDADVTRRKAKVAKQRAQTALLRKVEEEMARVESQVAVAEERLLLAFGGQHEQVMRVTERAHRLAGSGAGMDVEGGTTAVRQALENFWVKFERRSTRGWGWGWGKSAIAAGFVAGWAAVSLGSDASIAPNIF